MKNVSCFQALFLLFALAGCYSSQTSWFSSPNSPGKEILINNERYYKPRVVLGPVSYTLRKNTTLLNDQLELRNQAIDLLKQTAYARYGQQVDAIEELKVTEKKADVSSVSTQNVTHVEGTAVAFLPENKAYTKPKSRVKTVKSPVRKPKPSSNVINQKEKSEDITITPSEILK